MAFDSNYPQVEENRKQMLSASELREIRLFNQNCSWLRQNQSVIPQQKEWITYDEASKIIDAEKGRSKDWFHEQRTNGNLIPGVDCRKIGKTWEYKRLSIEGLKEKLATI